MRYTAYLVMLTSAYPKQLFGDEPGSDPEGKVSATRPLVMSGAGRGLLVLFLVLGLASAVTSSVTTTVTGDDDDEVKNVTGPLLPGPLLPGPSSR